MPTSPFLNLPRELRDQIYTHALHHPTGLHLTLNPTHSPAQPTLTHPSPTTRPLALTQTSTLLRTETSTLPYTLNDIHLHTTFSHQIRQIGEPPSAEKSPFAIHQALTAWLEAIGERNAGAIRRVKVHTPLDPNVPARAPPIEAATYILFFQTRCGAPPPGAKVQVTFTFDLRLSNLPGWSSLSLPDVDLQRAGATSLQLERALLAHARKIRAASADSKIDGQAVVRLLMRLENCKRGFRMFGRGVREVLVEMRRGAGVIGEEGTDEEESEEEDEEVDG